MAGRGVSGVGPARLERATSCSGGKRSIQLSYGPELLWQHSRLVSMLVARPAEALHHSFSPRHGPWAQCSPGGRLGLSGVALDRIIGIGQPTDPYRRLLWPRRANVSGG